MFLLWVPFWACFGFSRGASKKGFLLFFFLGGFFFWGALKCSFVFFFGGLVFFGGVLVFGCPGGL